MIESEPIALYSSSNALCLAGPQDTNLKLIGRRTGAQLALRGDALWVTATAVQRDRVRALVELLKPLWEQGSAVTEVDVETALTALNTHQEDRYRDSQNQVLAVNRKGESIRPKTPRQQKYVRAIASHDLTFGLGPAGTGKTYLAAVMAIQALKDRQYDRLILTRPALEAGEKLGFLPGDLQAKINPYLRPLYDALYEFIEPEKVAQFMEQGTIEIAPLAYMRGRTLSNAFIILDEAQNTTPAQMKMVLTRIGFQSRMVVTGDLSQTDLGAHQLSGLSVTTRILQGVEGIATCTFDRQDVVRHPLVRRIVSAYEQYEAAAKVPPQRKGVGARA
ncbi:PhoH family protein [Synechococcus sp. PCC 7336]|uniref:PhoH family protein n=1 Tax=Synechococcus sp. PCC 7336 TaxID=195250 RepID=UPI000348068D|nr:PhoH family protein [Synechococcus sp. PCC 7336]